VVSVAGEMEGERVTGSQMYKNYSADWWTPKLWLDWATITLGGAYHDPCPAFYEDGDIPCGLSFVWPDADWYVNHPGTRGSTKVWWEKSVRELRRYSWRRNLIWCAFSVEQLRHMDPSPFHLPGWLVMPRGRTSFTSAATGEAGKSPANWAVFWTTAPPAEPPVECVIVRTGR